MYRWGTVFRQLEERRTRNLFGCRCTLIQAFLTALLGRDFAEAIELQQWLLIQMDTVAVNVKQSKDSERSVKKTQTNKIT